MKVVNQDLVIVRGINDTWMKENFSQMWIGFGGSPIGVPTEDAFFVGLYIKAPVSGIKYIGVVSEIERYKEGADFYLKSIIELPTIIKPGHAIRKHEYWNINNMGLTANQISHLRATINF